MNSGEIEVHFFAIEFQMRGLPHAHFVLITSPGTRPRDANSDDYFARAEIPDSTVYPKLHSIITTRNLHGPCGPSFPNQPCMQEGVCRWKFPQAFCDHTTKDDGGCAQYRRGKTVPQCERRGFILDNRWAVPFKPVPFLGFARHVNVLICSSVAAVRYLVNSQTIRQDLRSSKVRIARRSDRRLRLMGGVAASSRHAQGRNDEVTRYLPARYLSAPESELRACQF